MSAAHVLNADCLAALRDMPDASVDAIVTDPPYGLSNTTPAQVADTITRWVSGDREYLPSKVGFMGHEWDGFVPPVAVWDECLRVLKPGGHLIAFAGSRTQDLMGLAVRLAGFEIRDSVAWLYGSGFPKSMDVSKAIDKRRDWSLVERLAGEIRRARADAGLSLAEIGQATLAATGGTYGKWYHRGGHMFFETGRSLPSRPEWEQLRHVLPIAPEFAEVYDEAEREVIGVKKGAMSGWSMDGTTQFVDRDVTAPATDAARQWEGWGTALKPAFEPVTLARKPLSGTVAANVLEHGTGALNIDGCRVPTSDKLPAAGGSREMGNQVYGKGLGVSSGRSAELGGRWPANVVLDESQAEALDRQSGNRPGAVSNGSKTTEGMNGTGTFKIRQREQKPGYADQGGASRFFKVVEHGAPFMYCAKAPKSERPVVDGVAHSTVKPVTLMKWLVRMVTPPGGTVLDPFAGSGTTLEAAMLEGFNVIGVEREADYLPLIQARIERATTALAAQAEADADTLFPIDGAAS